MSAQTKVALERSRMTVKIKYLTARGESLLLESIATDEPETSDRLYKEAMDTLTEATQIRESFEVRFPRSLNLLNKERKS